MCKIKNIRAVLLCVYYLVYPTFCSPELLQTRPVHLPQLQPQSPSIPTLEVSHRCSPFLGTGVLDRSAVSSHGKLAAELVSFLPRRWLFVFFEVSRALTSKRFVQFNEVGLQVHICTSTRVVHSFLLASNHKWTQRLPGSASFRVDTSLVVSCDDRRSHACTDTCRPGGFPTSAGYKVCKTEM